MYIYTYIHIPAVIFDSVQQASFRRSLREDDNKTRKAGTQPIEIIA